MSFTLPFDEVPLIVSGVSISHVAGEADISSGGEVESISIENPFDVKGRRLHLTDRTADPFKRMLFELLSASIRVTCCNSIHEKLADYRRDNVASYFDHKRKMAAEMAG